MSSSSAGNNPPGSPPSNNASSSPSTSGASGPHNLSRTDYGLALGAVGSALSAVALLAALPHTRKVGGAFLLVAAVCLAFLAWTRIGRTEAFRLVVSFVVVLELLAGGLYASFISPASHHAKVQPASPVPVLRFVSSQTPLPVPWCSTFTLRVSRHLATGEKIAIFDASTDANFHAVSAYSFDGTATAVPQEPGMWTTGNIYVASHYRQDDQGKTIFRNGRPVSNAGYTVGIYAAVVRYGAESVLKNVTLSSTLLLSELPPAVSKEELDVVRNGETGNCPTGK